MDAHQLPLAGVEPDAPRPNHHLFFAVLPEPRAAQAAADLAQTLIARHDLQAQVRAQRLHATLLSLGWEHALSRRHLQWARDAAQQVRARAFSLRFDRVLSFRRAPQAKRPCVLCGPADGQQGFIALYEALHTALWSQVRGLDGVPHAPHITPHMTLCYSRQAVPEQPVPPLEWTVGRFVLLHNLRGSPGPYEVLGEWPLAD
ncbi:2'-5' RNA ligase family protein [Diaphorobacter sp.]|uniref:2'-5' RNA ligase family protein n=1 Tax=Diaphorobacter sp. TaxID=1934310 RepID=UPI0000DCEDCB|nr:2'-5' RNA ligase family protein [Diaphorobacter sp.]ABM42582.1 2',5' RNA ligase [Acidovorax sp. JS42]